MVSMMNLRGIPGIADSYHNVSDPEANSALMELEKGDIYQSQPSFMTSKR